MNYVSHSAEQTEQLGHALGTMLAGNEVLLLSGELGAGKTCLVRGLARGMGLTEALVSSPTFVIVNEYRAAPTHDAAHDAAHNPTHNAPQQRLCHIDAYRLSGPDDLDSIGWDELIVGDRVLAIEWPGRIQAALDDLQRHSPNRIGRITMEHRSENERAMTIDLPKSWLARPQAAALVALVNNITSAGGDHCRICKKDINTGGVFCSERCRMADLNRWFTGAYTVTRDATEDDFDATT